VIFRSSEQNLVSGSTTEAEFIAACETSRDLIWPKSLLNELKVSHHKPTLSCDSKSAINLIENDEFSRKTKHIDVKYRFIHDYKTRGEFDMRHVCSEKQEADFLTKAIPKDQFNDLLIMSNIVEVDLASSKSGGVLS